MFSQKVFFGFFGVWIPLFRILGNSFAETFPYRRRRRRHRGRRRRRRGRVAAAAAAVAATAAAAAAAAVGLGAVRKESQ